ncbi:hypothetical protein ACFP2F_21345 [Hymenobacter artigasi]|uniref:Stability/partitioning determinant n=1 Tax=Hymenobacter artigasi TaxID=2719616 RepID=A0ABX1HHF9_9BACT|nr:hypothetical protein [Hymenobacter artigasi]NKI89630.1 hypothetical protein [Hymenobacter artigasi]
MSKQPRPSFATTVVADITGVSPQGVNPDQALWPNAGTIRPANEAGVAKSEPTLAMQDAGKQANLSNKDSLYDKDIKPEKIVFSNKLEAATYLKLQQLATYGGENIQEILEAALTAYFEGKEEASRPLPPKVLTVLRKKYPFL